jgi:acylphosphatase
MKRVSVTVSGRVQGVGYRFFAQESARERGVTGWVRNEPGGEVSVEVQGSGEQVDSFCEALREGPESGFVTDVRCVEVPPVEGEKGFSVRY